MRHVFFKLVLLPATLACSNAQADETAWRTSWDGAIYGYASAAILRNDSVLNPDNQFARLPQNIASAEARFNLKAESDSLRLTFRPILRAQNSRNTFGSQRQNEAYLSQWQLRLRASETWNIAAGREVLNWGAAQFRSPSSPFYFDNGRNDPLRELSGMDTLKVSWTPDMQSSLNVARIAGSGHAANSSENSLDPWRNSWLLKADTRGDGWAAGLVLAKNPSRAAFLGAHGQYTVGDALLFYAEGSSFARAYALQSPADTTLPFSVATESPRRTTLLGGAAYTFESGQSLNVEMLHDSHGFSTQEGSAYFLRAAAHPFVAGLALGYAPPLLGRDYLHLVWQSNLMESNGYWRVMATHSFTDNGSELSGYGEMALTPRVTAFALAVLPAGNVRQEFSSLVTRRLSAGLKVALP